jgi:hypothetical protein
LEEQIVLIRVPTVMSAQSKTLRKEGVPGKKFVVRYVTTDDVILADEFGMTTRVRKEVSVVAWVTRVIEVAERQAVVAPLEPGYRHCNILVDLPLLNALGVRVGDYVLVEEPEDVGRRHYRTAAAWRLHTD